MNLSKSEMGRVSEKYLENIISKLNNKFQYNQWKIISTAIECFKAIQSKVKSRFIKLNVSLDTSISFAKSLINIDIDYIIGDIINIVNHAKKSLLFDDSKFW